MDLVTYVGGGGEGVITGVTSTLISQYGKHSDWCSARAV